MTKTLADALPVRDVQESQGGGGVLDDSISLAELEYLVETRQVPTVQLAGVRFVSLAGVAAYLERHADALARESAGPLHTLRSAR